MPSRHHQGGRTIDKSDFRPKKKKITFSNLQQSIGTILVEIAIFILRIFTVYYNASEA